MSSVRAKFGLWIGGAALMLLLAACGGLDGSGHGGGGGSGSGSNLGGGIGGSGDGGGDGDGGGGDSATEGQLQIALSGRDAPGFDSLRLSVTSLDVHDSTASFEDGWVPVELAEHDLDVVRLIDGRMSVLADAPLPSGQYDAIRVTFADPAASVLGIEQPLVFTGEGDAVLEPDAVIEVEADMIEFVELDFDAIGSVQVIGQDRFKLRPAVSIVNPAVLGSIRGTVMPLSIGAEVRAYLEPSGALVAASSVRADGSFTLPRLPVFDGAGVPREYRLLAAAPGHAFSAPVTPVDLVPSFTAEGFAFTLESGTGMAASEYYPWWEEAGNSGHAGGGNGNGGGKKDK